MCKYLLEYVCFIRFLFITHWKYMHHRTFCILCDCELKYFKEFDLMNVN